MLRLENENANTGIRYSKHETLQANQSDIKQTGPEPRLKTKNETQEIEREALQRNQAETIADPVLFSKQEERQVKRLPILAGLHIFGHSRSRPSINDHHPIDHSCPDCIVICAS